MDWPHRKVLRMALPKLKNHFDWSQLPALSFSQCRFFLARTQCAPTVLPVRLGREAFALLPQAWRRGASPVLFALSAVPARASNPGSGPRVRLETQIA